MKLQAKVLLFVVPLIIAPLIVFGGISYSQLRLILTEDLRHELSLAVKQSSRLITSEIQTASANVEIFAHSANVEAFLHNESSAADNNTLREAVLHEFATYQQAYPQYRELTLLDAAGERLVQTMDPYFSDESSRTASHRSLMAELEGFRGHIFTRPAPHAELSSFALQLAEPLTHHHESIGRSTAEPRLLGHFIMTLDLVMMQRLVRNTQIGDRGGIFMIDSSGRVLAHNSADWLGRVLPAEVTAAIRAATKSSVGTSSLFGGQFGEPRQSTEERNLQSFELAGQKMLLRAEQVHPGLIMIGYLPQSDLSARGRNLSVTASVLIATAVIAIAFLIVLVLRRVVVRPIEALNRSAQQLGQGNLLIAPSIGSSDEVGELYRSFAEMGRNLHVAQTELRKQTHEAEEASAAKSRFLAQMSHEIRTPLNGVLGTADLLSRSPLTPVQVHHVEVIRRSGKLLTSVIGDILDFTKIEAGRLEFRDEAFRLATLVADLEGMFESVAQERGLTLAVELAADLPPILSGDSYRLSQILTNLIGNGMKFTEQGGITLRIERAKSEGADSSIHFAVADTGIGISPEQRDRVFDAFIQVTDRSNKHYGGTGLGLAICKQLVEAMGGTIGAEGQDSGGSVFWFILPLKEASAADLAEADDQALAATTLRDHGKAPTEKGSISRHVLLAEDNQVNRDIAQAMLRNLGCEVRSVETGRLALEALSKETFDLVLMDCDMPDLDGYEATREIRRREALAEGTDRTPIIAQTANAFEDARQACLAAGMDGYLCKPFDQDELAAILVRWLPSLRPNPSEEQPTHEADRAAEAQAKCVQPRLDTAALDRIRALQGGDAPELLALVIEKYICQSAELLTALNDAAKSRDGQGILRAAHSLKSSSANLGAFDLADRLGELERMAREGQLDQAAAQVGQIERELAAVQDALRAASPSRDRGAA